MLPKRINMSKNQPFLSVKYNFSHLLLRFHLGRRHLSPGGHWKELWRSRQPMKYYYAVTSHLFHLRKYLGVKQNTDKKNYEINCWHNCNIFLNVKDIRQYKNFYRKYFEIKFWSRDHQVL